MSKNRFDTKTKIIKEAYKEFQKKGYKRANIDNIVKKAGVTKGALYYYFKSKRDLANCVIEEEIIPQTKKKFLNFISRDMNATVQESLLLSSNELTEDEVIHGSIFNKFLNEIPNTLRETHARMNHIIDEMVNAVSDKLAYHQQTDRLNRPVDTVRLGQLVSAVVLGSLAISKTYKDKALFTEMIKQFNELMDTLYE